MFDSMNSAGRTIVLVTHDMSAVQRFCQRALLINKGTIEEIGSPTDIADRYLEQNLNASPKEKKNTKLVKQLRVEDLTIFSNEGPAKSFSLNEVIKIKFSVKNESSENKLGIGLQIFNSAGVYCFGTNSKQNSIPPISGSNTKVTVALQQNLVPGTYHITLAIMNASSTKVLSYLPKIATFNIRQETEVQGVSLMQTSWEMKDV